MASQAGGICDAIVADLATLTLPATLGASRSYLATTALQSASTFQVFIAPASGMAEMEGRDIIRDEMRVVLTFLKRVASPPANADIDPLVETVEVIQDAYTRKRRLTVSGQTTVACIKADADPLYDPALLDEQGLFAAILVLTFSVWN